MEGMNVMKSYDFVLKYSCQIDNWYDAFLICIWMADLIDIVLEWNLGPFIGYGSAIEDFLLYKVYVIVVTVLHEDPMQQHAAST